MDHCTMSRCRQFVRNGDGVQIQDPDGTINRYCMRCDEKGEEALVAGGAVLALIVLLASSALFDLPRRMSEWLGGIL